MSKFKPMLAAEADLNNLKFPLFASPKLDGIRAIVMNGRVMSRSLKEIPNATVQQMFGRPELEGLDGELIVGEPTSKSCYRDTVSVVMSHEKTTPAEFYAFDMANLPGMSYGNRLIPVVRLSQQWKGDDGLVQLVSQTRMTCLQDVLLYEAHCLEQGYEGLILRSIDGPYKFGRSTAKEGHLLKLKRFVDAEAEVVGFEERMHNANEATTNELGRTQRSSHQAGKVPMGTLGALICAMGDIQFNIGTGFDDAQRAQIWRDRANVKGKLVKFKYFPVGVKVAPRHPVFLGWRDGRDL